MSVRKNPFGALVLSAVVPGSGQVYNQETKKGLLILGSCLGLGLLCYALSGLNRISAVLALLLLWFSAARDAYKAAATPAGRTISTIVDRMWLPCYYSLVPSHCHCCGKAHIFRNPLAGFGQP